MIAAGTKFRNKEGYEAVVLGLASVRPRNHCKIYTVQFIESGYSTHVEARNLHRGSFKDYGRPTVYGVGYSYPGAKSANPLLYKVWSHMLARCYNTSDRAYRWYGAKGVRVSDDWLHFQRFVRDAEKLLNYDQWLNDPHEFTLDKDIFSLKVKVYSRETCMWANRKHQSWVQERVRPVIAIDDTGTRQRFPSQQECGRRLNIQSKNINKVLQGTRRTAGGFRFEYAQ
ncbi:MAG TPA: hypothetical protein VFR08_08425 [Candidatus Angelobacter sp.]|nr:hypothetical protein [Candidatus Angelobacter sp.]